MVFDQIMTWLSGTVVVGFCVFLLSLAFLILVAPPAAERFLTSFAGSARAHYTEQVLRLLVGWAILNRANSMWHTGFFTVFGWLVVVSTIGLLLTPWRRHRQFAMLVMPAVVRRMRLFALGAAALGAFVFYSLSRAVLQ